jgi:hypothetical protein
MISIRQKNDANHSMLRKLVCSCCYPMDIVLDGAEERTANVLGVCGEPEVWVAKIRETIARFGRSVGQPAAELEIKIRGPWMLESDKTQLHAALFTAMGTKYSYV